MASAAHERFMISVRQMNRLPKALPVGPSKAELRDILAEAFRNTHELELKARKEESNATDH